MADDRSGPVEAPLRADGRRNRDQLLAAAEEIFAQQGTEASLREIARRAGLGIGTLYRHFPTREALLEALLSRGFDRLRERAKSLMDAPEPGAALMTWAGELAEAVARYDGLPASVMAAQHDPDSPLHAACAQFGAAARELLLRAQRSGRVRPDLTTDELLTTVNAMAWAARQVPATGHGRQRLLSLLADGLKTRTS